ncbi:NUDIX hydrolase [Lysinibacillus sp. 54212]|uniref:NUDIX hydrolase n=1 Tax=Lysinibacillus sp. 54212 TaxID=3119829 RepID=UPI002FC62211
MDLTIRLEQGVLNCRVAAVIIKEGYLLLHKNIQDDYWALPGGRIKLHENSADAIVRELKEELNIQLQCKRLLWVSENFFNIKEDHYHEFGFYYEIDSQNLQLFPKAFNAYDNEDFVYQWIKIDELNSLHIYPEFIKEKINDMEFEHYIGN